MMKCSRDVSAMITTSLLGQVAILLTVFTSHVLNDPCPFRLNVTKTSASRYGLPACRCLPSTREIHCSGLETVPDFPESTDVDGVYRVLYLRHQGIAELPNAAFQHLPSLRKILLDFNPLGERVAESAFRPPPGRSSPLRELSMAGCQLRTVPARLLSGMRDLRRLALWANEIRHIPTGFLDDALSLVEISLWGNRLDRITVDTFAPSIDSRLSPLRFLDLDRNHVTSLGRGVFRRLTDLESLRLGRNRINSLAAETFVGLSRLRSLVVSSNGLGFLYARAFDGLDSLLSLSLNDNAITFLPDGVFSPLHRLVDLHLQNNRLEYVWSRTFQGLRSLRRLDLSGNRLSNLPDDVFGHSPLLTTLALDDNQFKTLRRCLLPASSAAGEPSPSPDERRRPGRGRRTLSLIGNAELQCDCRLAWLAAQIVDGSTFVWGSCDVQQPDSTDSPLAVVDRRSPVLSVVMNHFFNTCPPVTVDCPTS